VRRLLELVLLGFTMFRDLILSNKKRQTIRKLRKRPIMVGDRLHLYWKLRTKECRKLGEAICTETFFIGIARGFDNEDFEVFRFNGVPREASQCQRLSLEQVSELALLDGFRLASEMVACLSKMHNILSAHREMFQVVRWGRLKK